LINEFTHAANQISKDEARWIAGDAAYVELRVREPEIAKVKHSQLIGEWF
jgi:hypothetical protein